MPSLHINAALVILVTASLGLHPSASWSMHRQATNPTGIFDVTRYGASGSNHSTFGSATQRKSWLKLDDAIDFKNGQGIKIEHAGPGCALNGMPCPIGPKPLVTVQGPPGSTTYTYQLAVIDERGGVGPAGPAGTVTDGPSTVNPRNYNFVRWDPVPAASGYALYRNNRLVIVLSGWTPEGYYDPPKGPVFTALFKDRGLLSTITRYPDVPATPPKAALADALVSTVTSGGGSDLLQLRDEPSTSVQRTLVTHDDSEAIQATFDSAVSGAAVYFPAGSYLITRLGFLVKRGKLKIFGSGSSSAILKDNLIGNSFAPWKPPEPCGLISPVDFGNVEISNLALYGLGPFGSSMTRRKKGVCASGSFDLLNVHDVVARNLSGEAIYADNSKPGQVTFTFNTVEDCAKNALNTNSPALANTTITDNVVTKTNGAAVLVVSQRALVARNKITGGLAGGADTINVAVVNFFTIANNEITGVDTSLAATSLVHVGFLGSGLNGSGLVVGNVITDNQTLNKTAGGAIFVDDVSEPVLIENNLIQRNGRCCRSGSPAISIANRADKVLIVNNTIRGSEADQDVGIRVEKSVSPGNHILIGTNDIEAVQPAAFEVKPNGGSESQYSELLRMAQSWPKAQAQ